MSYWGFKEMDAGDVPTPPAGEVRYFHNLATGYPSFKDSAGAVHILGGPAGSPGRIGPPGASDEPDYEPILIPGRRGLTGPTGLTGATGAAGSRRTILVQQDDAEDGLRGPPGRGSSSTSSASSPKPLQRRVASNSPTLDFDSFISASYDKYLFVGESLIAQTSTADLQLIVGTGGGPTYDTSGGNYGFGVSGMDTTGAGYSDTGSGVLWRVLKSMNNGAAFTGQFALWATGLQSTTRRKDVFGTTAFYNHLPRGVIANFTGTWVTTGTPATALRFLMSTGNISSGSITVYGYPNV